MIKDNTTEGQPDHEMALIVKLVGKGSRQ